jgi:hypothetical protein
MRPANRHRAENAQIQLNHGFSRGTRVNRTDLSGQIGVAPHAVIAVEPKLLENQRIPVRLTPRYRSFVCGARSAVTSLTRAPALRYVP